MYKVIEIREHEYAIHSQWTQFISMNTAIKLGTDSVNIFVQALLDRTDSMDEALSYLAASMFNALQNLL